MQANVQLLYFCCIHTHLLFFTPNDALGKLKLFRLRLLLNVFVPSRFTYSHHGSCKKIALFMNKRRRDAQILRYVFNTVKNFEAKFSIRMVRSNALYVEKTGKVFENCTQALGSIFLQLNFIKFSKNSRF